METDTLFVGRGRKKNANVARCDKRHWCIDRREACNDPHISREGHAEKGWKRRVAKGPVWMLCALKTLFLIHITSWMNTLFPLLSHSGNQNWPHTIKVRQRGNGHSKIVLNGCKWSSLKAKGTEIFLSYPLENSLFPLLISPLGYKLVMGRFRLQNNRNSGSLAYFSTITSNWLLSLK